MTNINSDRLAYLQSYFDNQLVTIEIPAVSSQTTKGTVINRFSGTRCGYTFHNGFAKVQKKDVHLFLHQHYIIHEEGNGE
jgi:hypothetical protein